MKPRLGICIQWADGLTAEGVSPQDLAADILPSRARLRRLIHAALALGLPEGDPPVAEAEFTLRLVDAAEGQALNREFRGKNKATNILTFPYSPSPELSADLVLCLPVLQAEATDLGIPLEHHLLHLVAHGVLHALGWEHEAEPEASTMEAIEVAVLARFRVPSPYSPYSA